MNKPWLIDNRGFSLVELLVSLTILSFGLLAVAQMQILAIKGNTDSGRLTEATNFLQDKLEEFRQPYAFQLTRTVTGYANPKTVQHLENYNTVNDSNLGSTTAIDWQKTFTTTRNNTYKRIINVANICNGGVIISCTDDDALMKEVNVIITWTEAGIGHEVSSRTLVSGKDMEFF